MAFHEILSPGIIRYPRTLIGPWARKKSLLRSLRRESEFRRFGKLGVSRVGPPPAGLPDSEFCQLAQLVEVVADNNKIFSETFLEQASVRLEKDCDLMAVADVIAVMDAFRRADYWNSRLMVKLANEVAFDAERIAGLGMAAVAVHACMHFNLVHVKLFTAILAFAAERASKDNITSVCQIMSAVAKIPEKIRANFFFFPPLKKISEIIVAHSPLLSHAQWAITLSDLVHLRLISTEELRQCMHQKYSESTESSSSFDLNTLSLLMELAAVAGDGKLLPLLWEQPLAEFVPSVEAALRAPATGEKNIKFIARRNKAALVAARILISARQLGATRLVEMYAPLMTPEAARGLSGRYLVDLAKTIDLSAELARKTCTLSLGQKQQLGLL